MAKIKTKNVKKIDTFTVNGRLSINVSGTGFDGKVVKKEQLSLQANDTLNIKFRFNDYFSKTASINTDFRFTQDSAQNEVIYSNNIELHLLKTDDLFPLAFCLLPFASPHN